MNFEFSTYKINLSTKRKEIDGQKGTVARWSFDKLKSAYLSTNILM